MDSKKSLFDELISEGKKFDWSNFCFPNQRFPGKFAGMEKPEWLTWKRRTVNAVDQVCGENTPATELAKRGANIEVSGEYSDSFEFSKSTLLKALDLTRAALDSDDYGELRTSTSSHSSPTLSNRVFVVHGHDSQLKMEVEQFIREIGLEPVVLHRQTDEGATIIEKFEKHADVGFAFVLLTPDEVAYTVDQEQVTDNQRKKERRARPNVIFEFGYFVGRLGRPKVCCLHKGEVAVPSDLSGLVYKKIGNSLDEEAYDIIRELKAVGYSLKL